MGTAQQVNHYKRIPPFVEMLLQNLNVDRIEVASARVSEGEKESVTAICRFAASIDRLDRVEVLGFVDGGKSIDWISECGGKVINLLAKGSLKHCTHQLHKTPEEHIADILQEVAYAQEKGLSVNLYLEDWSNGMKDSPEYVYQLMDALTNYKVPLELRSLSKRESSNIKVQSIKRFMLPDTLGERKFKYQSSKYQAFHVARHVGRDESSAGYRVFPQDEETLS